MTDWYGRKQRPARPKPPPGPSPGAWEAYEERAAIIEFESGLSREEAEEAAWKLVFGTRFLRQQYLDYKPTSYHNGYE